MSDKTAKGRLLRKLRISEVSLVDHGANQHAQIAVFKHVTSPVAGNRGAALLALARAQGEAHRANQTQAIAKSADAPASSGHARAMALLKSARGARDGAVPITLSVPITKLDAERRQISGWASVASVDGTPVVDRQGDIIDIDDLREAAHSFIANERSGLLMHRGEPVMQIVESFVVDEASAAALAITGTTRGWWIVAQLADNAAWQRVKSGELRALSIAGTAVTDAEA